MEENWGKSAAMQISAVFVTHEHFESGMVF